MCDSTHDPDELLVAYMPDLLLPGFIGLLHELSNRLAFIDNMNSQHL